MPDPYDTTEILATGRPHPAEHTSGKPGIADRERLNRRYGLICLISGVGTTVITVLVVALFRDGLTNVKPAFMAMTVIMAFLGLGIVGFVVGLLEILQRYGRSLAREAMSRQAIMLGDIAAMGHAIDMIAEHMTEHDQIVNWRGFNHAVREGFTGSKTGTDGSNSGQHFRGRSTHLGLVNPDHQV